MTDTVLCWDIDGTLLTTNRSGIGAWEDAIRAVLGRSVDLSGLETAGLTDIEIGERLLAEVGTGAEDGRLARLVEAYEDRLPARLGDRTGWVMPGVREFLEWNARVARLPSLLLTGNTRRGAAAKLRHYGLEAFFPGPGAFAAIDAADRPSIADAAAALAANLLGPAFTPHAMVVIGDTPHDITCGHAVGARTLGVATGTYSREALAEAGAWCVISQLPSPEELLAILAR